MDGRDKHTATEPVKMNCNNLKYKVQLLQHRQTIVSSRPAPTRLASGVTGWWKDAAGGRNDPFGVRRQRSEDAGGGTRPHLAFGGR